MTRISYVKRASVAVAALVFASCSTIRNGPEQISEPTVRFPITVEPHMATLRVPYSGPGASLDPNTNAQLARFAKDYLERGAGAIAVSASRRYPQAPSEIADRLIAFGIPRDRILVGNQDAPEAEDDVRITYIRYEAEAPACGDWSENLGSVSRNRTSPNFGCATQHNLAAMVADPRDLVAPRELGPDDAQRRLTVLEKYRKGENTITERTQAQSGAVSAVTQGGGM